MPIYGYQCSSCGHQKDVLQKLADPNLTECPECGAETFARQVSAPAFQLKGSGWYVTDFRDGDKGKQSDQKDGAKSEGGGESSKSSDGGSTQTSDSNKSSSAESPKSGSSDKSSSSPAPAAGPTDSSASK